MFAGQMKVHEMLKQAFDNGTYSKAGIDTSHSIKRLELKVILF